MGTVGGQPFHISPEMFDWGQVRALSGPRMDINRVVFKPLPLCLGYMLRVVILSEGEPSALSDVLSALDQVFIEDIPVLCSI